MASEGFHEPPESLSDPTRDHHRAVVSLAEELEAIDWYDQRVDATADAELAEVLAHNRDEEKEHAAMVLEWLRRRDSVLDRHLRTYLFRQGSIVEREVAAVAGSEAAAAAPAGPESTVERPDGSLGIGSLR